MEDFNEEKTYRNNIDDKLTLILEQVKRTNGRVSNLERWQSYVIGFCACIAVLILPLLWAIIQSGKI